MPTFSLGSEQSVSDLHYLASLRFGFDIFVLCGKSQDQIAAVMDCVGVGWPKYPLETIVGPARQRFAFAVFARLPQRITEISYCLCASPGRPARVLLLHLNQFTSLRDRF